jgi:5-methylcytosine-specific restriction endonuclease McrA
MKFVVEVHALCKEMCKAVKAQADAKGRHAGKGVKLAEAVVYAKSKGCEFCHDVAAWEFGKIPARDVIKLAERLSGLGVVFSPRALKGLDDLINNFGNGGDVKFLGTTYKVLNGEWGSQSFAAPKKKAAHRAQKESSTPPDSKEIPFARHDPFYKSGAWIALRYKVLLRDGRKCASCGITPNEGAIMNVDHIKPRRKYPHLSLEPDNLQVLCSDCNAGKGNWSETDFRKP